MNHLTQGKATVTQGYQPTIQSVQREELAHRSREPRASKQYIRPVIGTSYSTWKMYRASDIRGVTASKRFVCVLVTNDREHCGGHLSLFHDSAFGLDVLFQRRCYWLTVFCLSPVLIGWWHGPLWISIGWWRISLRLRLFLLADGTVHSEFLLVDGESPYVCVCSYWQLASCSHYNIRGTTFLHTNWFLFRLRQSDIWQVIHCDVKQAYENYLYSWNISQNTWLRNLQS